jgi:hypothetical protein
LCGLTSVDGDLPNFRDDFLGHLSLPMTEFYGKRTVDKYVLDVDNIVYYIVYFLSIFFSPQRDAVRLACAQTTASHHVTAADGTHC